MSLEKKDTKIYLKPEVHRLFSALADSKGMTNAQLGSLIVTRAVLEEAHAATVIAEIAKEVGIDRIRAGMVRESAGLEGNDE